MYPSLLPAFQTQMARPLFSSQRSLANRLDHHFCSNPFSVLGPGSRGLPPNPSSSGSSALGSPGIKTIHCLCSLEFYNFYLLLKNTDDSLVMTN